MKNKNKRTQKLNQEILNIIDVSVKVEGKVYSFSAQGSLDFAGKDVKKLVENHTIEYYKWRVLRDKVRSKLRKYRMLFDRKYGTDFCSLYTGLSNRGQQVNKALVDGYIGRKDDIVKMGDKIKKFEDKLDILDTIVYSLEQRKGMLYLLINNIECQG